MKKTKRGIAVFDTHFPEHHVGLWENIMCLIADVRPHYFVLGGDNLDMTPLSHWIHEKGQARKLEGKRIKKDYDDFNNCLLDPLNELLRGCEKHWLNGNHEDWAYQYIDKNPNAEGFMEPENNLNLKGWQIYQLNEVCKIGKMHFFHGIYTNDNHSKKHVQTFERNVFYGHLHDFQVYTKITPVGNEPHIGMSVPCACHRNPDYMRNKPSRWLNGLLVFDIYEDGSFTAHPIIANDGVFTYNGKTYK